MSPVRFVKGFAQVLILASFVFSLHSQVTVYQDSATPEAVVGNYSMEYGDEVMLTGTARILTKLRFEYGGSFFSNGDEQARVRIYANNGSNWKGNADYTTPGTLLWESPLFPVLTGYNTKDLLVPSIRVPDRFTWTIQFYGLSMSTLSPTPDPTIIGDYSGLSFYGLAEIGASFNDFWQLLTEGWTPVRVGTVVKNNFAASVTALQEVIVPTLTITKMPTTLKFTWPRAALGYKLQGQSDVDGEWADVGTFSFVVGDQYQCNLSLSNGFTLFRLRKPLIAAEPTVVTNLDGTIKVSWPSSAFGKVLQSKASEEATFWGDETTPAGTTAANFEVTLPSTSKGRVFRLREETKAASIEIIPQSTNLLLRWPAEAAGYRVQSRPAAEGTWTYLSSPISKEDAYFTVQVPIASEGEVFRLVQ
jgi:hypothetical protein